MDSPGWATLLPLAVDDTLIASSYRWVDRSDPYLRRRADVARTILALKERLANQHRKGP